jgi:hypothetical protein
MASRYIKRQVIRYGVCSSWEFGGLRHLYDPLDAIRRWVLGLRSLLLRIQYERKSVRRGMSRVRLAGCRCDCRLRHIRIHAIASRSLVDVALLLPYVDQVALVTAGVLDDETDQDEQDDDAARR